MLSKIHYRDSSSQILKRNLSTSRKYNKSQNKTQCHEIMVSVTSNIGLKIVAGVEPV